MNRLKRGPYKKYATNSSEVVPRRTQARWDLLSQNTGCSAEPASSTAPAQPASSAEPDQLAGGSTIPVQTEWDADEPSDTEERGYYSPTTVSDPDDTDEGDREDISASVEHQPRDNVQEGLDNAPLFHGCSMSSIELCVILMNLFFKFNLTREFLSALLFALNTFLPHPHNLPTTTYTFFKLLSKFRPNEPAKEHFFCKNCHTSVARGIACCPLCMKSLINCGKFLQVELAPTLRSFLEDERMYEYFSPQTHSSSLVYSDLTDGDEYKKVRSGCSKYDFSLFWNTDGVKVFKSSASSLWPLHCVIPELPPRLRKKFQLLTLLWCGSKPDMNTFLRPFCLELKKLASEGLKWIHPVTGQHLLSRIFAPVTSVDAVAKALLQNIRQFNGLHGCSLCEAPGETFQRDRSSRSWIYLPGTHALRTGNGMRQQAVQAVQTQTVVQGVKGPSVLSLIPQFDLASSFTVDYMHCVLLGVVRTLMAAWFDTKHHQKLWYLGRELKTIDARLLMIQPPDFITRTPRSIKHRMYWKASEFRAWLLFYSLPVLCGILPVDHLQHFMLLVAAIHMLLKDSIRRHEIDLAETFLTRFVEQTPSLYAPEFLTFNVHQLTHLCLSVRRWGPLWATSAFLFEDRNGELVRIIQGTRAIDKQLATLVGIGNALNSIERRLGECSPLSSVLNRIRSVHFSKQTTDGAVKLHGRPCRANGKVSEFLSTQSTFENALIYKRATIGSVTFTSSIYETQKLRNNRTVKYTTENGISYASIECFVRNGIEVYAVVDEFSIDDTETIVHEGMNFSLSQFVPVYSTAGHLRIVPLPQTELCKCIFVLDYIVSTPNLFEINL